MSEDSLAYKEVLPDKNISKIKEIFGINSFIEPTTKGYKIRAILQSGVCEGGQKIEIDLSKPFTSKEFPRGMKMKKLLVNGVDATKYFAEVIFETKEPDKIVSLFDQKIKPLESSEKEIAGSMAIKELEESHADLKLSPVKTADKKICIKKFEKADQLVSLFHEQGHVEDSSLFNRKSLMARMRFHWNLLIASDYKPKDYSGRRRLVSTWRMIVKQEATANRNALRLIERLSEKVKLFPVDEAGGFPRVKKYREIHLESYLNISNGWYLKQISPKELMDLTKLE